MVTSHAVIDGAQVPSRTWREHVGVTEAKNGDVHNQNKNNTHSAQRPTEPATCEDCQALAQDKCSTLSEQNKDASLRRVYAECRTEALPPELARVVKAWRELPEAIHAAILAMIHSTTGGKE